MGRRKDIIIGNVVVPSDVDRDKYVTYALRTQTACVVTADGDFIKDCPMASTFCGVNDGWVNSLEFPTTKYELGTQVVCVNIPLHDIPIIVGCLKPKGEYSVITEEYQSIISRLYEEADGNGKITDRGLFKIEGKGLKGIINLIAHSSDSDGGKIRLNAKNDSETGEIEFKTNFVKIYGNKHVEIVSDELIELIVQNVVDGDELSKLIMERLKMTLISEEINIGENADEPLVKGDTLQALIEDILDALIQTKVTTSLGASPLLNVPTFTQLKTTVSNIKSEKHNIE